MTIPELIFIDGGVWRNEKKKMKTPSRFVLYYEIEYHRRGDEQTTINGIDYTVKSDTVTFNRPGDIRSTVFGESSETETEYFYFIVNPSKNNANFDYIIQNIPNIVYADEKIKELWNSLVEHFADKNNVLCEMQANCELLLLLSVLAEKGEGSPASITSPSPQQQLLFEAIQYMNSHLTENIYVEDIATHIGYSASHFNHLFKTYTHHTPHSYYISLKISEAKYMLLNTNKSISQISEELGFCRVGKFGSAFKKECRMTPGEFRRTRGTLFFNE